MCVCVCGERERVCVKTGHKTLIMYHYNMTLMFMVKYHKKIITGIFVLFLPQFSIDFYIITCILNEPFCIVKVL